MHDHDRNKHEKQTNISETTDEYKSAQTCINHAANDEKYAAQHTPNRRSIRKTMNRIQMDVLLRILFAVKCAHTHSNDSLLRRRTHKQNKKTYKQ
mmetsp:Transcript_14950/g.23368  ORF Transcript_14950/g.23368 Transcript_14950/m.23368 type:complete len:95 (-) Transcript_14950:185-469(-)